MVIGDITDCRLPSLLKTALAEQWLPNCLQMMRVPPPSVSHSCGLSLAYSHQSRVAAHQGPVWAEGSGQQHDRASVLVFLSPHLFRLSWHVTMYGPQRHLLAIRRLLEDSICRGTGRAGPLPLPWWPSVRKRETERCWHTETHTAQLPRVPPGLAQTKEPWPAATQPGVLCGGGVDGVSLLSLVGSLEFNLHHGQSPESQINQRSLAPVPDSAFHGWLVGLEVTAALHKLHWSYGNISHHL